MRGSARSRDLGGIGTTAGYTKTSALQQHPQAFDRFTTSVLTARMMLQCLYPQEP